MGNYGSSHCRANDFKRSGARKSNRETSWFVHSYPRAVNKVLPECLPSYKLRATENGVRLRNGGTITLRKQDEQIEIKNSVKKHKFYGSAPDISHVVTTESTNDLSRFKFKIPKSKKKYKAPNVPRYNQELPESNNLLEWDICQPQKRIRMFKTRAEIMKKTLETMKSPTVLKRSFSTPQFKTELEEKLMEWPHREPPDGKDDDNKVNRNNSNEINSNDFVKVNKSLSSFNNNQKGPSINNSDNNTEIRESCVGKDSSYFSAPESMTFNNNSKPSSPLKKFYFGMDHYESITESEAIEQFSNKLHYFEPIISSSSSSNFSSNIEEENSDIYVQLRATLPRKQLDIPRFSPAVAWRLLTAIESMSYEEDDIIRLDERIPIPPYPMNHIHGQLDKSADSGISGDASPQNHDSHNSQVAWTPQQDLEDSSSEGDLDYISFFPDSKAKFSPRFSLSLPRDDRLKFSDMGHTNLPSSGRNKHLIKSEPKNRKSHDSHNQFLDSNWVLSQSVPNSLHIANMNDLPPEPYSSLQIENDSVGLNLFVNHPTVSYLTTRGHVMYLPESDKDTKIIPKNTNGCSKSLDDIAYTMGLQKDEKIEKNDVYRKYDREQVPHKFNSIEHSSDLEALRLVEEEFQKNRESEKANIKHQLRIYNLNSDNKIYHSDINNDQVTTTKVLSEYRQSRRDYKEYVSNNLEEAYN